MKKKRIVEKMAERKRDIGIAAEHLKKALEELA
jgi:hypothetical protein